MSDYRRSRTPGGCYFFTVVTHQRQPLFADPTTHLHLRNAIEKARLNYPFEINGWVLMPDHLHCLWTLPEGDGDFSMRWSIIKSQFSINMRDRGGEQPLTRSQQKYRRSGFWQRRFWEHQIRDDLDYQRHLDYLHYNPVKHGLVDRVIDWPYSTFHRYVQTGEYPADWGGDGVFDEGCFGE